MSLPPKNLVERTLEATGFAGVAARNYSARCATALMGGFSGGQYEGARRQKTSLKNWNPAPGSADSDSIGDLETLRSRGRDLARNNGIARGARNTNRVNVVGTGLRLKPELQRELLGLSDAEAETWEDETAVLFDLWASSKFADVSREQNFYEMQALAFTSVFDSGDMFALRRYKEGASFLALSVALFEADRVSTPNEKSNDPTVRDGIEVANDGEKIAAHFRNAHPGDGLYQKLGERESWTRIPFRGAKTGERQVIHLYERDRIGQTRGVPALAPVMELLKQLDRYSEAELMAAVVSAFFTVFIKHTEGGDDIVGESLPGPMGGDGPVLADNQIALGSGTIADLAPGEEPVFANPARPNANFDPFMQSLVRQIGISLGIPFEVLMMHFSSSYSASRAALEVAWQFFMDRRTWLARNFCQPVYEWFLYEAVARGVIKAPGFLDDPIRRAAWTGSRWIGPAQISIDPAKEARADEAYANMGVETLEEITLKRTGGDFYRNQEKRARETRQRASLGLNIAPVMPEVPKPEPKPPQGGSTK